VGTDNVSGRHARSVQPLRRVRVLFCVTFSLHFSCSFFRCEQSKQLPVIVPVSSTRIRRSLAVLGYVYRSKETSHLGLRTSQTRVGRTELADVARLLPLPRQIFVRTCSWVVINAYPMLQLFESSSSIQGSPNMKILGLLPPT
jgi:hypothetical protein